MSEWKQGMLNCCHDGETCLLGFPCCFSCTSYRNAKGLGKPTPLLYGLLGCFLPCFAITILRGEAREQHRIWNLLKKIVKSRKLRDNSYIYRRILLFSGEAREQYGIDGSVGGDIIKSCCFCLPCTNCQLSNEVKSQGGYE